MIDSIVGNTEHIWSLIELLEVGPNSNGICTHFLVSDGINYLIGSDEEIIAPLNAARQNKVR